MKSLTLVPCLYMIRANQGHSIPVDVEHIDTVNLYNIDTLHNIFLKVHGTSTRRVRTGWYSKRKNTTYDTFVFSVVQVHYLINGKVNQEITERVFWIVKE